MHGSLTRLVADGHVPGLVAAVAGADGPVRVDVLGAAGTGPGAVPMRRDTPFRITSVTKPL